MNVDPRLKTIDDCIYRISIKALIVNPTKTKVLVCKEIEGWWNFPGGGLDYGEMPEIGLKRELTEELNISNKDILHIDKKIQFTAFGLGKSKVPKANLFYASRINSSAIRSSEEISGVAWIKPEKILSITLSPSLGDPKTLHQNLLKYLGVWV